MYQGIQKKVKISNQKKMDKENHENIQKQENGSDYINTRPIQDI